MAINQDPIPPEALPPDWGLAEFGNDRFVYRHRTPSIELIADSTFPDGSNPRLGLCRCWELRYRYFLTDCTISRSIACVTTRQAALDGLLECMHRIHGAASSATDPTAVGAILDTVSLSDLVPNCSRSSTSSSR